MKSKNIHVYVPDCIKIGLQFGTLSASIKGEVFEVITFRSDGEYSDGRHLDSAILVESFKEDLRRRDFAINVMVYNDREGLVDVAGDLQDLQNGIIRCVGDVEDRKREVGSVAYSS